MWRLKRSLSEGLIPTVLACSCFLDIVQGAQQKTFNILKLSSLYHTEFKIFICCLIKIVTDDHFCIRLSNVASFNLHHYFMLKIELMLELVSKELNHFGVIAGLFRQIGGSRFVLFCSFWRLFTLEMIKSVKVFPFSFWKIITKKMFFTS